MKRILKVLLAAVVLAPASVNGGEKKAETHRHPDLPISFKTYEGWALVPRPGDEGTFEMTSPGNEVTVMVWYTSTEQDARRYLMKMADMKGLEFTAGTGPESIDTGYHEAVALDIPGTLLAVIDNGRSAGYPAENALYIIQISCPPQRSDEFRELMHGIIRTVRITGEGGR